MGRTLCARLFSCAICVGGSQPKDLCLGPSAPGGHVRPADQESGDSTGFSRELVDRITPEDGARVRHSLAITFYCMLGDPVIRFPNPAQSPSALPRLQGLLSATLFTHRLFNCALRFILQHVCTQCLIKLQFSSFGAYLIIFVLKVFICKMHSYYT